MLSGRQKDDKKEDKERRQRNWQNWSCGVFLYRMAFELSLSSLSSTRNERSGIMLWRWQLIIMRKPRRMERSRLLDEPWRWESSKWGRRHCVGQHDPGKGGQKLPILCFSCSFTTFLPFSIFYPLPPSFSFSLLILLASYTFGLFVLFRSLFPFSSHSTNIFSIFALAPLPSVLIQLSWEQVWYGSDSQCVHFFFNIFVITISTIEEKDGGERERKEVER